MSIDSIPWDLLGIAITSGAGVYSWVRSITGTLERRLTAVEVRMHTISERIDHLPDSRMLTELRISMERLTVQNESLGERVGTLSRRFDLHEEAVLRSGR